MLSETPELPEYADVIVDIAAQNLDRTFQYQIPQNLKDRIRTGSVVMIPFGKGSRVIRGYVTGLSSVPKLDPARIKEIQSAVLEKPDEEARLVALAVMLKQRYGSTMAQALRTVIPVKRKLRVKEQKTVVLKMSREEAGQQLELYRKKNQTARVRLTEALIGEKELPWELLRDRLGITLPVVRALEEAGVVYVRSETKYRTPRLAQMPPRAEAGSGDARSEGADPAPGSAGKGPEFTTGSAGAGPELTPGQKAVVRTVCEDMDRAWAPAAEKKEGSFAEQTGRYLLHGVTGSGKTAVYIEVIDHVIRSGRTAIMLIPEIALTWQTVLRFHRRFGDRVSFIHSRLSEGERYDQFERARNGEIDVMIGPRSALFTPFSRLGLIVMDEEQEGAYQSEGTPRYHAREAALMRAGLEGAFLLLGSATPSVDAFYGAQTGLYRLLTLPGRINGRPLPQAQIVDLREELRSGNRSILSGLLKEEIGKRLEAGEQTMLFLNRRGYAGFLSCRSCGHVIKCPHCDVSLALHNDGRLRCHYCGYSQPAADTCPECGSGFLRPFRAGTQQIEEETAQFFPEARILRMDFDTTRKKDSYDQILSAFAAHKADILVGTQMIVKGHDFPDVTLVGVLAADLSLHIPDFRAGERTFQLITQAAGRAGRADRPGTVIVQTYSPDHYCITSAARQDYQAFYEQEITYRMMAGYPPAGSMTAVHVSGPDPEKVSLAAEYLGRISQRCAAAYNQRHFREGSPPPIQILGPADEMIAKIQDQYRKVLYLKAPRRELLEEIRSRLEAYVAANEGFRDVLVEYEQG